MIKQALVTVTALASVAAAQTAHVGFDVDFTDSNTAIVTAWLEYDGITPELENYIFVAYDMSLTLTTGIAEAHLDSFENVGNWHYSILGWQRRTDNWLGDPVTSGNSTSFSVRNTGNPLSSIPLIDTLDPHRPDGSDRFYLFSFEMTGTEAPITWRGSVPEAGFGILLNPVTFEEFVFDSSNTTISGFVIFPTPGTAGLLGLAGVAALRRRR